MIARTDLPLGFLAAQVVHAAGESSTGNLPRDTHAVVLAVPHEGALLEASRRLTAGCIPHVMIREPDAPWCGAATALGVLPTVERARVRRALSSLPLLRSLSSAAERQP